jgi:bacteriocin biosynthesis cyclodehydratase domain-containing protein
MQVASEKRLAEIHPRLRNDVVFLRVETGIYLRSSDSACVLKGPGAYEWMSILGPRMTGELSIAELCDGLDEKRRKTAVGLMRTLLDRGFARHTPPPDTATLPAPVLEAFGPQINFVEHFMHADEHRPEELFARFRASRVLVAGSRSAAAGAAVRGLLKNGLAEVTLEDPAWQSEFDADIAALRAAGTPVRVVTLPGSPVDVSAFDAIVYVAGSTHATALLSLTGQVMRADAGDGPRLFPVMTDGERAVIGPISGPAEQPCWVCTQLRLSANSDPRLTADFWRGLAVAHPGPGGAGMSSIAQGMIGNAVAFDVFRMCTGQLLADDERHAVIQDLTTLESHRERVLPHPECPLPHRGTESDDAGSVAPAEEDEAYGRASVLVSPNVGIMSGWTDESIQQIPLKTGRVRLGPAGSLRDGAREITAYDIETILVARTRAVRSAVSAYVGRLGPVGAGRAASAPDVAPNAEAPPRVAPERLDPYSGLSPLDAERDHAWLLAVSLHDAAAWQVPDAAVYPLSPMNAERCFEPTSSGAAAGWTIESVQEHGLCSALAYRALTAAVRSSAPPARLGETLLASDEEVAFALGSLKHIDRQARVYALPGAAPAFAALAVVDGVNGNPPDWTVGSGLCPRDAVRAAVLDAVGLAVSRHYEGTPADPGDRLLADFDPRVLADTGDVCDWSFDEAPVTLADAVASLDASGTRALFADTTTIDLSAVRGMVTGTVLLAEK